MLITHKRYLPGYGFQGHKDQYPVCIYTILSVNKAAGDCAAYEAVAPQGASDEEIATMKGGGNKISPERARELFPEIDDLALRYRR